ncbi:hypothetical protein [Mycoplasmopsis lipofaciens]|uniref:hypothetical protein n=1 Tax=Mycoplasmopsis lipofaciens TaxID=114884 RepID=UPI0004875918|nr:hypothetical protein [Mycoplasmopsis lipofaciens]
MDEYRLLETWNTLKNIIKNEKIFYSISKETLKQIKTNKKLNFQNFQLVIYWKDFILLKQKYKHMFYDSILEKDRSLAPFFKINNNKIFLNLIVDTTKENIEKLYILKNYKKLIYFGDSKRPLWIKMFTNKKNFSLLNIINLLHENRYLKYIVLNSNLNKFAIYDNLNINDIKKIKYDNYFFDYLKEFDE